MSAIWNKAFQNVLLFYKALYDKHLAKTQQLPHQRLTTPMATQSTCENGRELTSHAYWPTVLQLALAATACSYPVANTMQKKETDQDDIAATTLWPWLH